MIEHLNIKLPKQEEIEKNYTQGGYMKILSGHCQDLIDRVNTLIDIINKQQKQIKVFKNEFREIDEERTRGIFFHR